MYFIEVNTPYQRPEYLAGFDEVTRRPLWTRDVDQALHFSDRRSADQLNKEALLGQACSVKEG